MGSIGKFLRDRFCLVGNAGSAEGDFCVRLQVSDNGPSLNPPQDERFDDTEISVTILPLRVPPTADADGPYIFCPQAQPWFLDGSGSVNPDPG